MAYARACVYIYKNLDLKYRVQILRKMTRGRESETKRERARQREREGRERASDKQRERGERREEIRRRGGVFAVISCNSDTM